MSDQHHSPIRDNPFLVLEVSPGTAGPEVERAGQRWLSMLAADLEAAARYETPAGPGVRSEEKVRWALAELRDEQRRLRHAFWARTPREAVPALPEPPATFACIPGLGRWLGFGRRG